MTSAVVAKSSDSDASRIKGTLAPCCFATSAISASSVETIISENTLLASAVSIDQAIKGFPLKSFIFFRGMRLLPPLAGIMQIGLDVIIIASIYQMAKTN